MGKKSGPSPDPNIGVAAMRQAQLGEDFLSFTQQQYEESKPRQQRMDDLSERITGQQMRIADASEGRASSNFQRYQDKFVPMEDQYLEEVSAMGGATDQARAAGRAAGDMESQSAMQRGVTNRNLMSMGVNPNAGKFMATNRANELMAMAQRAGGMTNAREGARMAGISGRASAANLGRGMMADTTAAGGLALQGGAGAMNAGMGGNNYQLARQNTMQGGYQGAMAGNAGMATGLGNLYNAQVNQNVGQNNASAQFWGGMAQGAGMAYGAGSDVRLKRNIEFIRTDPRGFGIYSFEYRPEFKQEHGFGRFIGVMADEVEKIVPEAVLVGDDGYKRVNYAALGV